MNKNKLKNMNIYKALEKLSGFFNMLFYSDFCSDEELIMLGEIEDTIYEFAHKHESQNEPPVEFTCDCGQHMIRDDIYDGVSYFLCPKCKAKWLVGPQEV